MKEQFQKELKEKIKPGVKASDLKKLKKSKSADDLPSPSTNIPLKKSQSQLEIPLTQTKEQQITNLKEQVKFHAETAQNYLQSLQTSQAKVSELEGKLKSSPLEELDQSLSARHKNLKDWFKEYQKNKELDKELVSNIDEVSEELVEQDKIIGKLRGEVSNLKKAKESLSQDLELVGRLAESRKVPYYSPEDNWTYLKYGLYSLAAVVFTLWLVNNLKTKNNQT